MGNKDKNPGDRRRPCYERRETREARARASAAGAEKVGQSRREPPARTTGTIALGLT